MKVKLQRKVGHYNQSHSYIITIPKDIIDKFPELKRHKYVDIEIDFLGNIVIKPINIHYVG